MRLTCFYWDLPLGQVVAFARDVDEAREDALETLAEGDAARGELQAALLAEPRILGDCRNAVVAWHQ